MLGKVGGQDGQYPPLGVDGTMASSGGRQSAAAAPATSVASHASEGTANDSAEARLERLPRAPEPAPERPVSVSLQPPSSLQGRDGQPPPPATRRPVPAGSVTAAATRPQPTRTGRSRPGKAKPDQTTDVMAKLVAQSRRALDELASYQVELSRQERVAGALLPAEDVLLSIRRQPQAVRIEWPDGPHKGREVIYAADRNAGLMHVNMADSVVPVPRLSIPPDSPMALSRSRHPITEAGLDTIVSRLEHSLKQYQAKDPNVGRLIYGGLETPSAVGQPCQKFTQIKPDGETWVVYLDSQTHLPALVQANDPSGELLERYAFRNLKPNVPDLAAASAFDPDARWGQPSSLLSRLARSTIGSEPKPEQTPPR